MFPRTVPLAPVSLYIYRYIYIYISWWSLTTPVQATHTPNCEDPATPNWNLKAPATRRTPPKVKKNSGCPRVCDNSATWVASPQPALEVSERDSFFFLLVGDSCGWRAEVRWLQGPGKEPQLGYKWVQRVWLWRLKGADSKAGLRAVSVGAQAQRGRLFRRTFLETPELCSWDMLGAALWPKDVEKTMWKRKTWKTAVHWTPQRHDFYIIHIYIYIYWKFRLGKPFSWGMDRSYMYIYIYGIRSGPCPNMGVVDWILDHLNWVLCTGQSPPPRKNKRIHMYVALFFFRNQAH